jgi:hypothetical protein
MTSEIRMLGEPAVRYQLLRCHQGRDQHLSASDAQSAANEPDADTYCYPDEQVSCGMPGAETCTET